MTFALGKLELIEVEQIDKHANFLWRLLESREEVKKISSTSETDFESHLEFVRKHPYRKWYIVGLNELFVGSTYLSFHNEIGLQILPQHYSDELFLKILDVVASEHQPLPKKLSCVPENFVVNVSSKDRRTCGLMASSGFYPLQITFDLKRKA